MTRTNPVENWQEHQNNPTTKEREGQQTFCKRERINFISISYQFLPETDQRNFTLH